MPVDSAWPQSLIKALCEQRRGSRAAHRRRLRADRPGASCRITASSRWRSEDWVRRSQSQFEPIRISDKLWIVPSWATAPDPDAVNLVLDPGLAFGTGSHPSTRLCLQWLERTIRGGERVLDYGCGSGILAIAALRLGASAALGRGRRSAGAASRRGRTPQRNRVDARFINTETAPDFQADLVVANILANPLILLAPLLAGALGQGRAHRAVGHTRGAGAGGDGGLRALVRDARRRQRRRLGAARGPAAHDHPLPFLPYPFSRARGAACGARGAGALRQMQPGIRRARASDRGDRSGARIARDAESSAARAMPPMPTARRSRRRRKRRTRRAQEPAAAQAADARGEAAEAAAEAPRRRCRRREPASVDPSAAPGAAHSISGRSRRRSPAGPARRWPWLLGALLLLLVLLAQAAYHYRSAIIVLFPETKPYAAALCATLGCELPLPRRIELMSIEASDLQADTTNPNVMVLSATLKNRAIFDQQLPLLELTLTDAQDQPVVRRVLAPQDYLGKSRQYPGRIRRQHRNRDQGVHRGLAGQGHRLPPVSVLSLKPDFGYPQRVF